MTNWIEFKKTESGEEKSYLFTMDIIDGLREVENISKSYKCIECAILVRGVWIPVDGEYIILKKHITDHG